MSESENVKVKQSLQNITYVNKDTVFTRRKKQVIGNRMYYWVKAYFQSWTNVSQP